MKREETVRFINIKKKEVFPPPKKKNWPQKTPILSKWFFLQNPTKQSRGLEKGFF